jgi:hypothetical protein
MIKAKKMDSRLLSPKKQMMDLSQLSKKDGRSNDQINANQALVEIQKSSQRQLKNSEQVFKKNYFVNE